MSNESAAPPRTAESLWHIRGKAYDLTPFLDKHPGGRLILEQARGMEDATPLFESYHALCNEKRIELAMLRYQVDRQETVAPEQLYSFESAGFYADVKRRVRRHFGESGLERKAYKAGPAMVAKGAATCVAWLATFHLAFLSAWEGSPLLSSATALRLALAALSGVCFIMMGFQIMHDGSHYALFVSPRLNNAAMNVWCSLALWQGRLWHMHHVVHHHSYTGCAKRDPDGFHWRPMLRKHESHDARKTWFTNRVPAWLMPAVCLNTAFMLPGMWLGQAVVYNFIWKHKEHVWGMQLPALAKSLSLESLVGAVLGSTFLAAQLYCGSPLVSLAYAVSMNAAYAICIFPDHDTYSTYKNEIRDHQGVGDKVVLHDWGCVQVRNSGNCGGRIFGAFFGGINYQIEHHLFPSVHHAHLPDIAPLVKQACREHGVPYVHHTSVFAALVDFLKKMEVLNSKESHQAEACAAGARDLQKDVLNSKGGQRSDWSQRDCRWKGA